MELNIYHQRDKSRFCTVVRGQEAFINYIQSEDKILDIRSTHIPAPLRGMGIAGKIAEFAVHYAHKQHLKLKPSCPYVAQYLENNPAVYKEVSFT